MTNPVISNSITVHQNETISINGRQYKNVRAMNTVVYKENPTDLELSRINRISALDADYFVVSKGDKIQSSTKYYGKPVTRIIDGKEYKNIVSNVERADGSKTYEILKNGFFIICKKVVVSPDGKVVKPEQSSVGKAIQSIGNSLYKTARKMAAIII